MVVGTSASVPQLCGQWSHLCLAWLCAMGAAVCCDVTVAAAACSIRRHASGMGLMLMVACQQSAGWLVRRTLSQRMLCMKRVCTASQACVALPCVPFLTLTGTGCATNVLTLTDRDRQG